MTDDLSNRNYFKAGWDFRDGQVERVEFVEDQITIKHVIPISDVRLQRDQHNDTTPLMASLPSPQLSSIYPLNNSRCQ